MKSLQQARSLANYINSLADFNFLYFHKPSYSHMGALLSDCILQSGLNYKTVVEPRIKKILYLYPQAVTTSIFLKLLNEVGSNKILNWNHSEKPKRLYELTTFLYNLEIESEQDLNIWLQDDNNCIGLQKINGIGPKTIDYLKKLVNIQTIAVDRHIRNFVRIAGIEPSLDYMEIKNVVQFAADLLEVPRSTIDISIWKYQSK